MSSGDLARALLAALDEDALDELAARLAPRLGAAGTGDAGGGWLRGAEKIAAYIDCPVSRIYSLSSAGRVPIERDGASLVARRSELDAWLRNGGGKRP